MATSAPTPSPSMLTSMSKDFLLAQFSLYRGIVARKHNLAIWLPEDPSTMSGPELEQWVTFLKDAAHLPPG